MPGGLVSGEEPLSDLQMAVFSLCLHMAFPLCVCGVEGEERYVSSSSYRGWSKSRFTVVHMENYKLINKHIRINSVSGTYNRKPIFAPSCVDTSSIKLGPHFHDLI